MNELDSREQVSAFVDGELRDSARARVVDALYESPELRRTWARFHLIGSTMRNVGPVPGAGAIAGRVSATLSREPPIALVAPSRPKKVRRRTRFAPLPGLALAASISAVAVFAIHTLDGGGPQSVPEIAAPQATAPQVARMASAPRPEAAAARPVADDSGEAPQRAESARLRRSAAGPDRAALLDAYLVNHNEYAGNGMRGMLPYVRLVGHQSQSAGDHR